MNEINRLSGLAYILGFVIVESMLFSFPSKNFSCTNWQLRLLYIRNASFLFALAIPFTFLLVFHVVALCKNNKFIIAFFVLCWLAILAICMTMPIRTIGVQIPNAPYCVEVLRLRSHSILAVIGPGVHDISIFLATTWVLVKNSHTETRLRSSFNIVNLPTFSKLLLRDGQLYFLCPWFCSHE